MGKLITAIVGLFQPAPPVPLASLAPPASAIQPESAEPATLSEQSEPFVISAEASEFYEAFYKRLAEVIPLEILMQPPSQIFTEMVLAVIDEFVRTEKYHVTAVRFRSCFMPFKLDQSA